MNELWVHGNDFSYENIHDDSGVRVVLYEHYQALEAERDRYKAALEWARLYIDAADHKGAHDVLTQALKGGGDGHEAL